MTSRFGRAANRTWRVNKGRVFGMRSRGEHFSHGQVEIGARKDNVQVMHFIHSPVDSCKRPATLPRSLLYSVNWTPPDARCFEREEERRGSRVRARDGKKPQNPFPVITLSERLGRLTTLVTDVTTFQGQCQRWPHPTLPQPYADFYSPPPTIPPNRPGLRVSHT